MFQGASGDREGEEAVAEGDSDKGYPDVGAVPQLGLLPLRQPVPLVLLPELDDVVPDESSRVPALEGRLRGQPAVGWQATLRVLLQLGRRRDQTQGDRQSHRSSQRRYRVL